MIRVAIDGPAGVGKSSTSKALAKYYGFAYLDTGAMYRACAWWCMHKGIDLDAETIDEQLVTETVGEFFTDGHFNISVDPDDPKVYADDEDISEAIRSSEVSSHVSKVSNIIPVRHVLIAAQRAYIAREASVDSFSEAPVLLLRAVISPPSSLPTPKCASCLPRVKRSVRPDVADRPSRVWVRKMSRHATRPIRKSPTSHPPRKAC